MVVTPRRRCQLHKLEVEHHRAPEHDSEHPDKRQAFQECNLDHFDQHPYGVFLTFVICLWRFDQSDEDQWY